MIYRDYNPKNPGIAIRIFHKELDWRDLSPVWSPQLEQPTYGDPKGAKARQWAAVILANNKVALNKAPFSYFLCIHVIEIKQTLIPDLLKESPLRGFPRRWYKCFLINKFEVGNTGPPYKIKTVYREIIQMIRPHMILSSSCGDPRWFLKNETSQPDWGE